MTCGPNDANIFVPPFIKGVSLYNYITIALVVSYIWDYSLYHTSSIIILLTFFKVYWVVYFKYLENIEKNNDKIVRLSPKVKNWSRYQIATAQLFKEVPYSLFSLSKCKL